MSKDIFGGIADIARKIIKMFGGDPKGKAAKIKKVYIGDSNNKAQLYWWNVIMFTIDGTPYECAPNTTWGDWAKTYIVDGGISFDGGTTFVCDADQNRVSAGTVITEGEYITYGEPEIEYVTFTVDGKPQTVELGTKWNEWANVTDGYAVVEIGGVTSISKDGGESQVSKYDGTSVVPTGAIEGSTSYVSMVFFSVDDKPCFVTVGTTWATWANASSDYRVEELSGTPYITKESGTYVCKPNGNKVVATAIIETNTYTSVKEKVYISFAIGEHTYPNIEEGTSWEEWVATTNGAYYLDGSAVREATTNNFVAYSDNTNVSADESIQPISYVLWDGIVYITFYIADEEHTCPKGMNWADAITLGYLEGYRVKGLSLYDGYVINASDLRVVNSSNTPVHSSNPITEGYHYGIEIRNVIEFTVDGRPYEVEAETETTWGAWANATDGYEVIEVAGVPLISKDGGDSRLVDKDGYDVVATEVITGLAGPYVSRYYEEPDPELPVIEFTVDGTPYSVEGVQYWGTWANGTNGLYYVSDYNEHITKEDGVSRLVDSYGNEVKATHVIGGGTYTSVNYEIEEPELPVYKYTVDGIEYEHEGNKEWSTWGNENGYEVMETSDGVVLSIDGGISFVCDSSGNPVTGAIGNGDYSSTVVFTCDNVTRYFVVSYLDEEENVVLDRTWYNYIVSYNPTYEGMAEFYVQDNGIVIGGYGEGPVRLGSSPVYETDEICWGDTYRSYS